MNKNHSATKGCPDCKGDALSPKLGKLTVKHHISTLGGTLCASELEVISDRAYNGNFPVSTQNIAGKWGASRGHDRYGLYGFELCMAPSSMDLFEEQAADIESAFKTDEVYVDKQCGGHIHVDARSLCIDDICKLLQIYRYIEPALFKMIPAWRRSGDACPMLKNYYMDYHLDQVKGLESAKKFKADLETGVGQHRFNRGFRGNWAERHCGLNVCSMFQHGTVEFRLPPGLLRKADITGWQKVCSSIVNYAQQLKFYRLRLRNILVPKLPTIAESVEELNFIINKMDSSVLHWAQEQQKHATQNWNKIEKRKLVDLDA